MSPPTLSADAKSARGRPPIRALLIDISGTLLASTSTSTAKSGGRPSTIATPGAPHAIARLREAGIPFRLCSNASGATRGEMCDALSRAGFDAASAFLPTEVWTSLGALNGVMRAQGVRRPYMLLSPSACSECAPADDKIDAESGPHDAVVVGLAPSVFDYEHLNTAFRILVGEHKSAMRSTSTSSSMPAAPRPPLIALHKARYIQGSDAALSLGPGPFVAALEEATGMRALVVGKPTRLFFETVIRSFDEHGDGGERASEETGRIAVVGDDVAADLGDGAVELGLWRVLVKTGKYRSGDESRADVTPPDEMCSSFAEFVGLLLRDGPDQCVQMVSTEEEMVGAVNCR